jgi:hypothetical protein
LLALAADAGAFAALGGARRAGGTLFGVAGLVMALCCIAGPAILGAVAGAAIGNALGIAAAVAVTLAAAGAVVLYRRRSGNNAAC